jgi:HPt (histidine-containing phosphotransfer) domain-containing protein
MSLEAAPGAPAASDFDAADALARLGDDAEILIELIGMMREDIPVLVAAIRAAVEQADPYQLAMTAHSLKGALASLSADRAARAACALETAGRMERMDEDLVRMLVELEAALARAGRAFDAYLARTPIAAAGGAA